MALVITNFCLSRFIAYFSNSLSPQITIKIRKLPICFKALESAATHLACQYDRRNLWLRWLDQENNGREGRYSFYDILRELFTGSVGVQGVD